MPLCSRLVSAPPDQRRMQSAWQTPRHWKMRRCPAGRVQPQTSRRKVQKHSRAHRQPRRAGTTVSFVACRVVESNAPHRASPGQSSSDEFGWWNRRLQDPHRTALRSLACLAGTGLCRRSPSLSSSPRGPRHVTAAPPSVFPGSVESAQAAGRERSSRESGLARQPRSRSEGPHLSPHLSPPAPTLGTAARSCNFRSPPTPPGRLPFSTREAVQ
mmetsp:Transcript_56318/g.132126  ORF Transcript_56318/g.132126 Transcript_56318/m.132126 type:complete len:214 (-) Transcript_56318:33-674(-)